MPSLITKGNSLLDAIEPGPEPRSLIDALFSTSGDNDPDLSLQIERLDDYKLLTNKRTITVEMKCTILDPEIE